MIVVRTTKLPTAPGGRLWKWRSDPVIFSKQDWHMARRPHHRPRLGNEADMGHALWRQRVAHGPRRGDRDEPPPADFPPPRLAMPEQAFHPDYFTLAAWKFCSRRLREALAQPADAVAFIPVELVAGSKGAHAQDYALMQVLVWDEVLDLDRCSYTPIEGIDPRTGQPRQETLWIDRYAFRPDARPRHEVFKLDLTPGAILVTDAVAERVIRARCTGLQFLDPTAQLPRHIRHIRTADGVAEVEY